MNPRPDGPKQSDEIFFWQFIVIFSYFQLILITLQTSLEPRFPGVPALSVVIYVVKNASRSWAGNNYWLGAGSVFRIRSLGL